MTATSFMKAPCIARITRRWPNRRVVPQPEPIPAFHQDFANIFCNHRCGGSRQSRFSADFESYFASAIRLMPAVSTATGILVDDLNEMFRQLLLDQRCIKGTPTVAVAKDTGVVTAHGQHSPDQLQRARRK